MSREVARMGARASRCASQVCVMQTILGANGVIARELSHHLRSHTDRIRQASRSPRQVNTSDNLCTVDLLDADATAKAVAGSDVSYLVAGRHSAPTPSAGAGGPGVGDP